MDAQDPQLTEEVRVAMALNGGVSLAVWMGGAAVELDAARRAHLPDSERPVYAAICRAFHRELVLDLMTGSSAGGINGALLAGAIAWKRRLTPDWLRGKWIELGDFSKLLQPLSKSDPPSLMQGTYFHEQLDATFKELHAGGGGTALMQDGPISDHVRLEVTTTDMLGGELRYRDVWGEDLVAHEYRRRFCFEKRDETSGLDPAQLAIAARSSASFPVAFEPFGVPDGLLAGLDGKRYVLDGGLLDNAPIADVIALIPTRSASRQVRRYLCYVNADPPLDIEPAPGEPAEPKLGAVALAVVGLPRKATFVDHLNAIKHATREGRLAGTGEQDLVKANLGALRTTAGDLLGAYRERRRVHSLEDVLPDPRDVEDVNRSMPPGLDLPWIPTVLAVPPGGWGWGVRAAQRALHLLIDVLRAQAREAVPDVRVRLFAARAAIDAQAAALEAVHRDVSGDRRIGSLLEALPQEADREGTIRALAPLMVAYDAKTRQAVSRGVQAALAVVELLDPQVVLDLFGPPADDAAREQAFLDRALAIEVVRRAFYADDVFDTAQRLSFAQLTPCAPALILTSRPLNWQDADATEVPPATAKEKLTGLPLAHFAAFYRDSWRANDFMWGRLDGAVRVVDMLVDGFRAVDLADHMGADAPWAMLAEALTLKASPSEQALLTEVVGDGPGSLRVRLQAVLEQDLREGDGKLTRAVCARALQHEILQDELPNLRKSSAADAKKGAGAPGLDISTDMGEAIDDLRTGPTLPQRLGVGDAELASDLGLRTIAHAAMVGVAAVRTAGTPLGDAIGALRAPFLPVAGTVARKWGIRAAVAVAFTAFAVWLGWRAVAVENLDARGVAPAIEDLSLWTVVATLLAALGVLTTAAVAAWRAVRMRGWRARVFYGGGALALLATGGAVALGLAAFSGHIQWDEFLTQADATDVPDAVLILVAATSLGIPALVMLGAGRIKAWSPISKAIDRMGLTERLENFVRTPYAGLPTLVLLLAPWVALLVYGVLGLIDTEFAGWRTVALGAMIGAPVVALLVLLPRPRPRAVKAKGLGLAGLPAPQGAQVTVTQRPLPPGTTVEREPEEPAVRD
jgi:predicted acylesterase/phospholipase RssA